MKDIIRILSKPSQDRSRNDILIIAAFLRNNENLMGTSPSPQYETILYEICKVAQYKFAVADEILFKKGDFCSFWCILLSGSVIIDKSLFLPNSCFGMRQKSNFRNADCIVLEDSHLVIVKFPEKSSQDQGNTSSKEPPEVVDSPKSKNKNLIVENIKKSSVASESCDSDEELENSYSEEEENENDIFWESLLKEQNERNPEDIKVIFNNIKGLPAFSCLTTSTVLSMCSVMTAAMVREAGQKVLHHGELMDTWSVILNGCVEITDPDGSIRELSRGDSFGVKANQSTNPQKFRGDMFTVTEDCHFVCINQEDYIRIMDQEGQTQVTECGEGGRILLVYEEIKNDDDEAAGAGINDEKEIVPLTPTQANLNQPFTVEASGKSNNLRVVTKGTPEKLIEHLMNELSQSQIAAQASITDIQSYAEDFFLTYRTFLDSPRKIVDRLIHWYKNNSKLRLRVKRCVLLWVHQYFSDFEDNPEMIEFLAKFDQLLSLYGNASEKRLLNLACSTRAKPRTYEFNLTVFRPKNPSKLTSDLKVFVPFIFIGNTEENLIFLKQVDTDFEEIKIQHNPWPFNRVDHPILDSKKKNVDEFRHKRPLLRVGDQVIAFNDEILTTEPGRSKYQKPTHLLQAITNFASNNAEKIEDVTQRIKTLTPQQQQIYQQGSHILQSCRIKLTLVFNPLQFNQLMNKLSSGNTNQSAPNPPQRGPQNIPLPNRMSPSQNRKSALPTSVSIPHGMSVDSNVEPLKNKIEMNLRKDRSNYSYDKISMDESILNGSLSSSHPDLALSSKNLSSGSSVSRSSPRNMFHSNQSSTTPHRRNPLGGLLHAISHGNLAEDLENSEKSSSDSKSNWLNSYSQSCLPFETNEVQVIRVWKASDDGREQSSKLVLIKPWTTAREAKVLALDEFGIVGEDPDNYSFYMVSVVNGPLLKASKIANTTSNLANKIHLNSRYYLRSIQSTESFMSDEIIRCVLTESKATLLHLDCEQLALMMTSEDHKLFRNVEASEYINEIFNLENSTSNENQTKGENVSSNGSNCSGTNKSRTSLSSQSSSSNTGYYTGTSNLTILTDLVNVEAYWAPTEICSETNLVKRVEILKKFIKLAKYFRALRNYNAMFCLLMGLHQSSVERLRQTWDRVPNKYMKIFREISIVLDTSRNFGHYRSLLNNSVLNKSKTNGKFVQQYVHTPILPYLPLVMKDLTFIHLGNATKSDEGLINFVKLRMIAKEIRNISRVCSIDFDYRTSAELLNKSNLKDIFNPTNFPKISNASITDVNPSSTPQKTSRGAKAMRMMIQAAKSTISNTIEAQNDSSSTNRHRSHSTGNGNPCQSNGNPKKIYEQWHTYLQLKTYLNNLEVITNADQLMELSHKIEPPRNQTNLQLSMDNPSSQKVSEQASNDDSGLESESNLHSNKDQVKSKNDSDCLEPKTSLAQSNLDQSARNMLSQKNQLTSIHAKTESPIPPNRKTSNRQASDHERSYDVEPKRNLLKHTSSIRESMQSLVPVPYRHQYHAQRRIVYDKFQPGSNNSNPDHLPDQSFSFQKMIMNRQMMEKTLMHSKNCHNNNYNSFNNEPNYQNPPKYTTQKPHQNICVYQNNSSNNTSSSQISSLQALSNDLSNVKLCKKHASQTSFSPAQASVAMNQHSQINQAYSQKPKLPQYPHHGQNSHFQLSSNMPSQRSSFDHVNQFPRNNPNVQGGLNLHNHQSLPQASLYPNNMQSKLHAFASSKYDPMNPQLPNSPGHMGSSAPGIYDTGFKTVEVSAAPCTIRPVKGPPSYHKVYSNMNKTSQAQANDQDNKDPLNKSYDSFLRRTKQKYSS